jgi:hypothetical protein
MDRKFLLTGLGYAILGLLLGLFMAASKNHQQLVTHAHIMLVGFFISIVYAVMHKLWLTDAADKLAKLQYLSHQLGAAGMTIGLFMLHGGIGPQKVIGPVLGIFSILVLVAMVLMKVMYLKSSKA